jgi:hypothetical protein
MERRSWGRVVLCIASLDATGSNDVIVGSPRG